MDSFLLLEKLPATRPATRDISCCREISNKRRFPVSVVSYQKYHSQVPLKYFDGVRVGRLFLIHLRILEVGYVL